MSQTETKSPSRTVQTGQPVRQKGVFFEIAMDGNGKWHWQLWSANGRPMANNSIEYDRKKDVVAAVKTLQKAIPTAKYILKGHADEDAIRQGTEQTE